MKIFQLLRNPIIKTIGIVFVLYFALFANKRNPESLGNRLSADNIKKNLNEVSQKSKFIITNVKAAKELAKEKEMQNDALKNDAKTTFEDVENGSGDLLTACGDEVEISYSLYDQNDKQLEFVNSEKFTIGSQKDSVIDKNLIGLKQDGVRNIKVPHNFVSNDKKLAGLLKFNQSDLKYRVTLLGLKKHADSNTTCN
jgi:hypothetical protein